MSIYNRTLLVGPIFRGKIYLLLKMFSRLPDREIYIITKSSAEQYSNPKIKNMKLGEEVRPLSEDDNAIIVFWIF